MNNKKILLVDDEPDCLDLLKDFLEKNDLKIDTAENGLSGLELCKKHKYEIIITDINMPIMNGVEFISNIQKLDYTPIVIVMSALTDFKIAIDVMKKGAYDYLSKPVNIEDLLMKIRNAFEIHELRKTKDILEKERIIRLEKQLEFLNWKERFLKNDTKITDENLFENMHRSFTQGYGFGNLVSIGSLLISTAKESENGILINPKIFKSLKKNIEISEKALDEFLSITQIGTTEFKFKEISFNELYEILNNKIEDFSSQVRIKKQKIIINEFLSCPKCRIQINDKYFNECIEELILNALKFSKPESKIIIIIEKDDKELSINFINEPENFENNESQNGIPFGYENLIFEPFFRLTKTIQEDYNTLDFGLGLSKIEMIIKKHNGKITTQNLSDFTDVSKKPIIKINFKISFPLVY